MLKDLLLVMLAMLPVKADLLLYIEIFKLLPLFLLSNGVCAMVCVCHRWSVLLCKTLRRGTALYHER